MSRSNSRKNAVCAAVVGCWYEHEVPLWLLDRGLGNAQGKQAAVVGGLLGIPVVPAAGLEVGTATSHVRQTGNLHPRKHDTDTNKLSSRHPIPSYRKLFL